MQRNSFIAALLVSGLLTTPLLAQSDTSGGTTPPGKAAAPSVESNRNATPHTRSHAPRHHAHSGPGKDSAASVKANQGDTGMSSSNTPPPGDGAAAGAGGPASLSNNRDQGTPH